MKVMDKFTGSPKFKALVMVPEKSLPSDASYKSEGASDAHCHRHVPLLGDL